MKMYYVQSAEVVVGNIDKAGHVRSESRIARRISGTGNGCHGPTPEVTLNEDDFCLVIRDLLVCVAPLAR